MARSSVILTPLILYLIFSIVNSESPCENTKKEQGICMSTWDCIRQDGRRLGICAKGYLFGVCCSLTKIKSPFDSIHIINKSVISPLNYSTPSKVAIGDARHMIKLMTTRPTIDPFSEIVTTVKPVRTVKVLHRENITSTVATTPRDREENTTIHHHHQHQQHHQQWKSVRQKSDTIDNEIAIDSLDKATTATETVTHVTCCSDSTVTPDSTIISTSHESSDSTSSTPTDGIVSSNNSKINDSSVTTAVTHDNVMHNQPSTQITIESTGETIDTDASVVTAANVQQITTVTLLPDVNTGDSVKVISSDEYFNLTSLDTGDTTDIIPERDTVDPVTGETLVTSVTGIDSTTNAPPSSSSIIPVIHTGKVNTSDKNHTKVSTERPYVSHLDCGVRPLNPYARVVGGRNAQFGEWPWQVLIKESTWLGLFVKTKCGGVLVDHKWVLTAAHCRPGFLGKLVVIVGEYDLTGDFEKLKPVVKQVKRMVVHRDYNPETFENDIALLELESKFEVQPHVIPICLPETTSRDEYVGKIGHVAGWGKLSFGGPVPSILQVVKLPVIPNSQCQRMFLTAGHHKVIRNTFLCAGYNDGGKDSCEGDSGGPLMIQEDNGRWTLIGTVSHGIKCAEPNLPGVYMRTSAYRPWIDSIIRSDSHTYKTYTVNFA